MSVTLKVACFFFFFFFKLNKEVSGVLKSMELQRVMT